MEKEISFQNLKIIKNFEEQGRWIVEGYAVTDALDTQSDIISDEAIRNAGPKLIGKTVYFNHDKEFPIGKVLKTRFDRGRMWVKIEISKSFPEIWAKIQNKELHHLSIRGTAKVEQVYFPEWNRQVKIAKDLEPEEVSIVLLPANPEAETLRSYIERKEEKTNMPKKIKLQEEETEIEETFEPETEEILEPEVEEEAVEEIESLEDEIDEALEMAEDSQDLAEVKSLIHEVIEKRRKKKEEYPYAYPYPYPRKKSMKVEDFVLSAYTECMSREMKAGKTMAEAAKVCKVEAKEKVEKARRRKYPYPYAYAYPYAYPYPYPKGEGRYPYPYAYPYAYPYRYPKRRLKKLADFLDELLTKEKDVTKKRNLKMLKALVSPQDFKLERSFGLAEDPTYPIYLFEKPGSFELAEDKFRKEILRVGKWYHWAAPGGVLEVTKEALKKLVDNFKKKIIDHVYVPVGHSTDPLKNVGEVKNLFTSPDGNRLFADLEIKDSKVAEKIKKGLIKSVSASIDENYLRKDTGEEVGPVLLHVALVSEPYIKGLQDFIALSEDAESPMILCFEEDTRRIRNLTLLEEMIKDLSREMKLEEASPEGEEKAPEEEVQKEETPKEASESGGEAKPEGEESRGEEKEVDLAEAEMMYEKYLKAGKIVPAQKDVLISLLTSKGVITLGDSQVDIKKALITFLENSPVKIDFSEHGVPGTEVKKEEKKEIPSDVKEYYMQKLGLSEDQAIRAWERAKEEEEKSKSKSTIF